jgi:transposase InsO family protein
LELIYHFYRYAVAFRTRNQTAKAICRILFEKCILHYCFPNELHIDLGKIFTSNAIIELCKIAGLKQSRTIPYQHLGDGMVQKFNKIFIKMFCELENKTKENWKSYISTCTLTMCTIQQIMRVRSIPLSSPCAGDIRYLRSMHSSALTLIPQIRYVVVKNSDRKLANN